MICIGMLMACSTPPSEPDRRHEADVVMITDKGEVFIKLFDETPKHKENFLKLTREGFYDGLNFHRVMRGFIVQTGDPRTREGSTDTLDDAGYKLAPEINEKFVHTEGMVGAARYPDQMNPNWESSSSQFYIVTGKPITDATLDTMEQNYDYIRQARMYQEYQQLVKEGKYKESFNNYLADQGFTYFGYSDEQRQAYRGKKGAPHLDFMYTLFGEVVQGMDVISKIEYAPTDQYNRPVTPIRIQRMMLAEDYFKQAEK